MAALRGAPARLLGGSAVFRTAAVAAAEAPGAARLTLAARVLRSSPTPAGRDAAAAALAAALVAADEEANDEEEGGRGTAAAALPSSLSLLLRVRPRTEARALVVRGRIDMTPESVCVCVCV